MKNKYVHFDIKVLYFWLMLCVSIFPQILFAQNNYKSQTKKNTVYIELLGSGPIANVSYGRQIILSPFDKLSFDLGIEYSPYISSQWTLGMSPQWSYMHGKTNYVECGLGCYYDFYWNTIVPFPKIGYRYQKKEGGLLLKLEATPMFISLSTPKTILPWAGVAIGWAF